ncbi:hypothetical protein K438DRAFT_563981 [Mycena galopus ATCC 62051]|nr:hypothetical protein K438DRAFT_563981 [Mycena galopus ATCC 62051]
MTILSCDTLTNPGLQCPMTTVPTSCDEEITEELEALAANIPLPESLPSSPASSNAWCTPPSSLTASPPSPPRNSPQHPAASAATNYWQRHTAESVENISLVESLNKAENVDQPAVLRPQSASSVTFEKPPTIAWCPTLEEAEKEWEHPWARTPEVRHPVKDPQQYTQHEKEYPPDRYGEEAGKNARVWKVYRDKVNERDADLLDGWNKTLDILLLFAGLFSAVSTAFVIESYQNLQPDFTEYTANATLFTAITLAGGSVNVTLPVLQLPQDFAPTEGAQWINALWFTSLALALVVSLLAILAKQWLTEYNSRMLAPVASQRRWVWRHLAYNNGLDTWKLPAFISTLPLILHVSLFLFLAGLVVFLWDLDRVIAYIILGLTLLVLVFYVVAFMLPLWKGDCPTATPLLRQIHSAWTGGKQWFTSVNLRLLRWSIFRRKLRHPLSRSHATLFPVSEPAFHENRLIATNGPSFDITALKWMITSLPVEDEVIIALDAIAGLDITNIVYYNLRSPEILSAVSSHFSALSATGQRVDPAAAARCLRTMYFLDAVRYSADPTLERWVSIQTHDLHILSAFILDSPTRGDVFSSEVIRRHRTPFLQLKQWNDHAAIHSETPFLESTALLLMHSQYSQLLNQVVHMFYAQKLHHEAADPVGANTIALGLRNALIRVHKDGARM